MTTPQAGQPSTWDFSIYRGDAQTYGFVAYDADGNYLQFAGMTARAQLRAAPEAVDVLLEFTCAIIVDPGAHAGPDLAVAKMVTWGYTGTESAAIDETAPRICYWDIQVGTAPDYDDAQTYLRGVVGLDPDVTR